MVHFSPDSARTRFESCISVCISAEFLQCRTRLLFPVKKCTTAVSDNDDSWCCRSKPITRSQGQTLVVCHCLQSEGDVLSPFFFTSENCRLLRTVDDSDTGEFSSTGYRMTVLILIPVKINQNRKRETPSFSCIFY